MNATLLSRWNETLRAQPDAVALVDAATGRTWTRASLDAAANDWCAQHGAELAGRLVVLVEPNGAGWLTVFLGLLKSGAVVAPLDPGEPEPTQDAVARARGASFLWREAELRRLRLRAPHADGRRLVKFTSGSTRAPRAIPFTDAQMIADGEQVCATMDVRATDVNFALIPFGHSYGLGNLVVPLLNQGTAIACGSSALPHVIAGELAATRATVFPGVPALLRALAAAEIDPAALQHVRTFISAGAPLPGDVARGFHARFGKTIHGFYGSSETGGITYDRSGNATLAGRSVGLPLTGVRLDFVGGKRFRVTSPAVFTLGNRRAGEFGTHAPADLAELNEHGELVLLARTGRIVKIAGRRVNLAEVEHALRQLSGVRDAFAAVHADRDDALAAAVVSQRAPVELRTELAPLLAAWKIPRKLVALAEFPLTARGKTDTRRLSEILGAKTPPDSGRDASPRHPM